MRRILCIDYNYYLVPDNIDLNGLLSVVCEPVSREYVADGNKFVYRSQPSPKITLELVPEAEINPPIPAVAEAEEVAKEF
jgi:hypothetical protein